MNRNKRLRNQQKQIAQKTHEKARLNKYPKIRVCHIDKNNKFEQDVSKICKDIAKWDKGVFDVNQMSYLKMLKSYGFNTAMRKAGQFFKLGAHEASIFIGEYIFKKLEELGHVKAVDSQGKIVRGFTKSIPHIYNFHVNPDGLFNQDYVIKLSKMEEKKIGYHRVFQSPYQPQITINEKKYSIAFLQHAIERCCERVVANWNSYAGYGDAYAIYGLSLYHKIIKLANNEFGLILYHAFDEGYALSYRMSILLNGEQEKGEKIVRLGYCPLVLEGDYAIAKTMLYPGMNGTPEHSLIKNSNLTNEEKNLMSYSLNGININSVLVNNEAFETLKWCHAHGVKQIEVLPNNQKLKEYT